MLSPLQHDIRWVEGELTASSSRLINAAACKTRTITNKLHKAAANFVSPPLTLYGKTNNTFRIYKSIKIDIIMIMEPLLIYKALSNETRSQIMLWLKNPEQFFDEQPYLRQGLNFRIGVCVGDIQARSGLAQSVISSYLVTMQKAGLLESERIGKWTYYRRNEQTIQKFSEYIKEKL